MCRCIWDSIIYGINTDNLEQSLTQEKSEIFQSWRILSPNQLLHESGFMVGDFSINNGVLKSINVKYEGPIAF